MKNKFNLLLCLTILCFSNISKGKFITTYSVNSSTMKQIEDWSEGKDTVIFINLDGVLMMPKSLMFSYGANPYRKFIDDMVTLGRNIPAYNKIIVTWYQQRLVRLVEEDWVAFIKRLQKKNISVYGIYSPPIDLVNIQEQLYQEAKNLGINFTNSVNNKEHLFIDQKEPGTSMFHKGIITTGAYSKSHTLMEFLRVTNLAPKKLVFIDNAKSELKRVEKMFRVFDMEYYNILYLAAIEQAAQPDVQVVKLQQRELISKGRWIEDEEAINILKNQY